MHMAEVVLKNLKKVYPNTEKKKKKGEPEKKNGAERKNAPSAPVLFVPFRTIKLPALPVCSVNLQIQVASRNLRPYIRVWFTSRTLHRTGGYNDRR